MLRLDDLQVDTHVLGIEPSGPVKVLYVKRTGGEAVDVTYELLSGQLLKKTLFRADEAKLSAAGETRVWPFSAEPAAFKRAAEATRIKLAHLFDPMMAVHTSDVMPLPHQIAAVYETKGTAVGGVQDAGVLTATKGKVRLLRVKEYPKKWDPRADARVPVWEACHQMCRALGESESDAGALLARMPEKQDAVRQLAYRLFTLCERKKRAEEARAYNELVTSWPGIVDESHKVGHEGTQLELL